MAATDTTLSNTTSQQAQALTSAVRQLRAARANLVDVVAQMDAQKDGTDYSRIHSALGVQIGGTTPGTTSAAFYNTVNAALTELEAGDLATLMSKLVF